MLSRLVKLAGKSRAGVLPMLGLGIGFAPSTSPSDMLGSGAECSDSTGVVKNG